MGNKLDLERKLPFEEIEATVCLDWECGYAECSALTGSGVEGVFRELMAQARIVSNNEEFSLHPTSSAPRRPSLLKRLFSREKTKEYYAATGEKQQEVADSCKIS